MPKVLNHLYRVLIWNDKQQLKVYGPWISYSQVLEYYNGYEIRCVDDYHTEQNDEILVYHNTSTCYVRPK